MLHLKNLEPYPADYLRHCRRDVTAALEEFGFSLLVLMFVRLRTNQSFWYTMECLVLLEVMSFNPEESRLRLFKFDRREFGKKNPED